MFHGDHLGGPVVDVLRPGRYKRLVRLLEALDAVVPSGYIKAQGDSPVECRWWHPAAMVR